MSKPEDISEEAWDSASRFMERDYPCGAKEFVARAIMAAKAEEREACALIADLLPRCELKAASPGVSVERSFKTGADVQAVSIAAAIRARSA